MLWNQRKTVTYWICVSNLTEFNGHQKKKKTNKNQIKTSKSNWLQCNFNLILLCTWHIMWRIRKPIYANAGKLFKLMCLSKEFFVFRLHLSWITVCDCVSMQTPSLFPETVNIASDLLAPTILDIKANIIWIMCKKLCQMCEKTRVSRWIQCEYCATLLKCLNLEKNKRRK